MKIQTLNKSYQVIQILPNRKVGYGMERMVAKNDQKELCFILRFTDPELIHKMIPIFMNLQNQGMAEDFMECFSKESDFYAVFAWHMQTPFVEKIKQPLRFLEKLVILKNLLEKLITLKLSNYFIYEVLHFPNIMIADSLKVEFQYTLYETNTIELIAFSDVANQLAIVIKQLFAEELKKEMIPKLKELIEDLQRNGRYRDLVSIYQKYREIYKIYESGTVVPKENSTGFRIWNKLKQGIPYLKRIVKILLLLAILAYLVYTILNPTVGVGDKYQFKNIGTLEIQMDEKK